MIGAAETPARALAGSLAALGKALIALTSATIWTLTETLAIARSECRRKL